MVPKKEINHCKVIGKIMAGDFRKTNGTHQNTTIGDGFLKTKGSFTGDRWTQLTLVVNVMTHTTFYAKQIVSFFCSCESFISQHE